MTCKVGLTTSLIGMRICPKPEYGDPKRIGNSGSVNNSIWAGSEERKAL